MMLQVLLVAALAQPVPSIVRVPAPAPVNWRQAPLHAGTWLYRSVPGGSEALFQTGQGTQFVIRCTLATRRVSFVRMGAAPTMLLRIMTTSSERTLPAGNAVTSSDPLLDAVAFSRGRFAVAAVPAPMLVMPTWAEPARAIEDCRK